MDYPQQDEARVLDASPGQALDEDVKVDDDQHHDQKHRQHGLIAHARETVAVNLADKRQVADGVDHQRDTKPQDVCPGLGQLSAGAVRGQNGAEHLQAAR